MRSFPFFQRSAFLQRVHGHQLFAGGRYTPLIVVGAATHQGCVPVTDGSSGKIDLKGSGSAISQKVDLLPSKGQEGEVDRVFATQQKPSHIPRQSAGVARMSVSSTASEWA